MRAIWLFPFERFNGILRNQPTNNRSIEIQLMRRFHKDNSHVQLVNEAKYWPLSDMFLDLITDTLIVVVQHNLHSVQTLSWEQSM